MAKSLPVIATTSLLLQAARNTIIKGLSLCAAAAASTVELFDGVIGTIATQAVGAGGTGYVVGDLITLVQAGGGVQATYLVAAETAGVVTDVTLVQGGSGYTAGSTYATTTDSVAGADLTITASTVTDAGVSVAKLACVANESAPPLVIPNGILTQDGVSVRITGASAKAHVIYE